MKEKNKTNDGRSRQKRLPVPNDVTVKLWTKAAGRCEFRGCNRILYEEDLTHENGNFSNFAHILPNSEKGPRGHEITTQTQEDRNSEENFMLLCPIHHKLIDARESESKYPASLLREMKKEHEDRIRLVTSADAERKSLVVIYQTAIGRELPFRITANEANFAISPDRYPLKSEPTDISSFSEASDTKKGTWEEKQEDLRTKFKTSIAPGLQKEQNAHVSVFALAPIPLLVQLGALLSKADVTFYHPRLRAEGWKWKQGTEESFDFVVKRPEEKKKKVALVLSISGTITPDRVASVLGEDCSIWEITVDEAFRNAYSITTLAQLKKWGETVARVIDEIKAAHRESKEICIFPAIPVPCALELGHQRFNKADLAWIMYDQNGEKNRFIKTITIKTK